MQGIEDDQSDLHGTSAKQERIAEPLSAHLAQDRVQVALLVPRRAHRLQAQRKHSIPMYISFQHDLGVGASVPFREVVC